MNQYDIIMYLTSMQMKSISLNLYLVMVIELSGVQFIIWSEIIRVISKSNERAARVRFEFTSMISDQNCTIQSTIATLLDPF